MSYLPSFMYQQPPSLFISIMAVINLIFMATMAISEIRGKHLQYSKFWNADSRKSSSSSKFSGRCGMLLAYTPSLLVAIASFVIYPLEDLRFVLVCSVLAIHFFKRDLEVLFIHKYSSNMVMDSAFLISFGYVSFTVLIIYAQYLNCGDPEPPTDLKFVGIVLFLVGLTGNFYHHYLLSKLRKDGNKEYKIPKGGLFGLVICPHYFFEVIEFFGISFIAQTLLGYSVAVATVFYLAGRSYVTRRWYVSKFEDFPTGVRALIPYVF